MFLLLVIPIEKLFSILMHMRAQKLMHFTRAYCKMLVFNVELDKCWSLHVWLVRKLKLMFRK